HAGMVGTSFMQPASCHRPKSSHQRVPGKMPEGLDVDRVGVFDVGLEIVHVPDREFDGPSSPALGCQHLRQGRVEVGPRHQSRDWVVPGFDSQAHLVWRQKSSRSIDLTIRTASPDWLHRALPAGVADPRQWPALPAPAKLRATAYEEIAATTASGP